MSDHKPPTDDELAEWKEKDSTIPPEYRSKVRGRKELLRCIEEIERQRAENKGLREELCGVLVRNHCAEMEEKKS